jgi:hypothetical protein
MLLPLSPGSIDRKINRYAKIPNRREKGSSTTSRWSDSIIQERTEGEPSGVRNSSNIRYRQAEDWGDFSSFLDSLSNPGVLRQNQNGSSQDSATYLKSQLTGPNMLYQSPWQNMSGVTPTTPTRNNYVPSHHGSKVPINIFGLPSKGSGNARGIAPSVTQQGKLQDAFRIRNSSHVASNLYQSPFQKARSSEDNYGNVHIKPPQQQPSIATWTNVQYDAGTNSNPFIPSMEGDGDPTYLRNVINAYPF